MTTLYEFLKAGTLGNLTCRASRKEVLAFIGPGFKTWADEQYEELIQLHAFGVFLNRGPYGGIEGGTVSGFGFYLAHGDVVPPHLAFPDFNLTPSAQAAEIIQFMSDNSISFEGESHFTVTEGGVVLLHHTPKLTSLVFPCPATGYWKTFVDGEPAMEKLLKRCHSALISGA